MNPPHLGQPPARLALSVALLLGCSAVELPDGERRVALRATAEAVILPTYAELSARTRELSALASELEQEPGEVALTAMRDAFAAARSPLKEAEAFGFGPAVELHSAAALDQSPVDGVKLEAELGSATSLSAEYVESLGANKRGLHAVEYLLYPGDPAAVSVLLADTAAGARRRQFLSLASEVVASHAAELEAAWAPAQGGHFTRFTRPGEPDSVTQTVQAALDNLLNESVFLVEYVANTKLGRPLGADTGGRVNPALQESERSGLSISDMRSNLRGVRNVYLGSRDGQAGPSLSILVRAKSPSTDARAKEALATAEQSLLALPEPFTLALTEQPSAVSACYETVKNLKRLLATEVLGSLGASLKFNDNDGD